MELKQYLADTFRYNSWANKKVLDKIKLLPDKSAAIRFFSHLINCQYKWMARIKQDPEAQKMDWWDPQYPLEALDEKWNDSLRIWLAYIENSSEKSLETEVPFIGFDGGNYVATPADIALQLNYHSIHHRAQIQAIIREQGLTPDFIDYIGTRYRKIS